MLFLNASWAHADPHSGPGQWISSKFHPSLMPIMSGAPPLTSSHISCRTLEKSSWTTSSPGRSLCSGLPPGHRACEKFRLSLHLHRFPHCFSSCWPWVPRAGSVWESWQSPNPGPPTPNKQSSLARKDYIGWEKTSPPLQSLLP